MSLSTWVEEGVNSPVELHVPGSHWVPGDANDGADWAVLGSLLCGAPRGGDGDDGSGLDVVGCLNRGHGGGGSAVQLVIRQKVGLGGGNGR